MTPGPAVQRGLERQLGAWRERLAAGERRLGWKIGLNLPGVQQQLGIDAPVIGFMTSASLADGEWPLEGMERPVAEAEVAIHMGVDLAAGESVHQANAAIEALGPAIEVVDVAGPFDDVEEILAGNVRHRGVALGEPVFGAELGGVHVRVRVNGEERAEADALEATGDPGAVALHVASLLESAGERLLAGDVIIAGSMALVPPEPGDEIELELGKLATLSLRFS